MNFQQLWIDKYIPKLKKAKRLNDFERIYSWLDIEEICGVEVNHLTPLILLRLEASNNSIITGGNISFDDVLSFFWAISKEYDKNIEGGQDFYKKYGSKIDSNDLYLGIKQYLNEQFLNKESSKDSDSGENISDEYRGSNSDTSTWLSGIIDRFSSQYGWNVEYVLNMPLPRILQLTDKISDRMNPERIKFDPIRCSIQAEFMKECQSIANRENKNNAE